MRNRLTACAGALLGLLAASGPAAAEDFYAGKDITLYVGSPAGGPYDAYARLLSRGISAATFRAIPMSWCRTCRARAAGA